MNESDLDIERVVLSDIEENAYIVALKNADSCVIVDPGMEPLALINRLLTKRLTPEAILVTHGHWDHIGGVNLVRKHWSDVTIYVGVNDRSKLTDPNGNLSPWLSTPHKTYDADVSVTDGDTISVANLTFKALWTPGHTSGHMVYLLETESRPIVFCGDLIFESGVGRTDIPDGNSVALYKSVTEKILTLPDQTLLYPGHGNSTTVGNERRFNPFLN
ncbi:MAG: MBL fold metallo-hydrolase [Planctomycetia bacterium]|nr:MBL fold metallo-hydrolase [Planctomycetia bacterium]